MDGLTGDPTGSIELFGYVTESGILEFYFHGEKVANVPAEPLVLGGGAPVYDREKKRPEYLKLIEAFDQNSMKQNSSLQNLIGRVADRLSPRYGNDPLAEQTGRPLVIDSWNILISS